MNTKQSNKQGGTPAVHSSVLLGRLTGSLLRMIGRIERARRPADARNWSEACRNMVVALAIGADKAASLNNLARVTVTKANGKCSRARRKKPHLLSRVPTAGSHKVIGGDIIAGTCIKRDAHARAGNRNVKNVVKHKRTSPNAAPEPRGE